MLVIICLESAVTKAIFKSKGKMTTEIIFRREIFSRLSGIRAVREMLSGQDFTKADFFIKNQDATARGTATHHEKTEDEINCASELDGEPPAVVESQEGLAPQHDSSENKDKGQSAKLKNNESTIHVRRLILPVICRVLLLIIEIAVIGLSGQTLQADGNGHQPYYYLVGTTTSPALSRGCTVEFDTVRGEQSTGSLETCTSTVFRGSSSATIDTADITFARNYLDNSITFLIATSEETSDKPHLSVTSTYRSYDGFVQSLMPLDNPPPIPPPGDSFFSGTGFDLFSIAFRGELIREGVLNLIFDGLMTRLKVPESDIITRFNSSVYRAVSGEFFLDASFKWNGTHDLIHTSLNATILEDFA